MLSMASNIGNRIRLLSFGHISASLLRTHNPRSLSVLLHHRNPPVLPFQRRCISVIHRPLLCLRPSPPLSSMSTQADSEAPQQPSSSKTVRIVIKGSVEGVWYILWTVKNAKKLGLKGWIRHRLDGSLEALFSGAPEDVEEMQQRYRRLRPASFITGLEVFPSTEEPGTGFEYRSTV